MCKTAMKEQSSQCSTEKAGRTKHCSTDGKLDNATALFR